MGVIKTIPDDESTVRAWVMMSGTMLCVDQRFGDWFGKVRAADWQRVGNLKNWHLVWGVASI